MTMDTMTELDRLASEYPAEVAEVRARLAKECAYIESRLPDRSAYPVCIRFLFWCECAAETHTNLADEHAREWRFARAITHLMLASIMQHLANMTAYVAERRGDLEHYI